MENEKLANADELTLKSAAESVEVKSDEQELEDLRAAAEKEVSQEENEPEPAKQAEAAKAETSKPEKVDKTLIPEDMRKRIGIPDKFKYWEDYGKWGSEAEKNMSRMASEKAKYERELAKFEGKMEVLEKNLDKKVDTGEITEDDKQNILKRFEEEWEVNKAGAMDRLLVEVKKQLKDELLKDIESQNQAKTEEQKKEEEIKAYKDSLAKEEAVFREKYKNWDEEIRPEIMKIAGDNPHLRTFKEAFALYRLQQDALKEETEAKRTEKKAAFAESGTGASTSSESIESKIDSADSLEELEKIAKKIGVAPRTY